MVVAGYEAFDPGGENSRGDIGLTLFQTVNFNVPPYDNPSHSRDGPFEVSMGG